MERHSFRIVLGESNTPFKTLVVVGFFINTLYLTGIPSPFSRFFTSKNTIILPNFLVWKFCGKAQFPHCFRRIARNFTETVTFHKISKPASYIIQKLCKGIHRELFKNKILPVQKQIDRYNCGPFAIAFTAEVLDGKSPMEARFDVERMRGHLINCLENKFLMPFPKFLIRNSFATSFDEL